MLAVTRRAVPPRTRAPRGRANVYYGGVSATRAPAPPLAPGPRPTLPVPRWMRAAGLVGLLAAGCATRGIPIPTDVSRVLERPEAFRNQYVEVQGRVEEYEPPRGDEVRTWSFVVRDLDGTPLEVYTDGRDPEDVEAADRLVRRALDAGEPVFVIGYLRTGRYKGRAGGPRLDLRQVQHREDLVDLGRRDYYYDPYYCGAPVHYGIGYYHGYHYYYHGH